MIYRMLVEIEGGVVRVSDLGADARVCMRGQGRGVNPTAADVDEAGGVFENVAEFDSVVGAAVEIEARLEMAVEEHVAWGFALESAKSSRRVGVGKSVRSAKCEVRSA